MKNKVLNYLRNSNDYISGEVISNELNVSRTSVWKSIKKLKELGYNIESSSKKGYKLLECPDVLIEGEIKPLLTTSYIGNEIIYYNEIESTNSKLMELAKKNATEGTVMLTDKQTKGKGRLEREWIAEERKNIFMSLLIRPKIPPYKASGITQVVALSVLEALESLYNIKFTIKWPNDIIANGKKVCGILCEMDGELDKLNFIVIGIGINTNQNTIDNEIKHKATSLKIESGLSIERKVIVASVLNRFEENYETFKEYGITPFIKKLKEYSALINKNVKISNSFKEFTGKIIDIDDEGYLIVKTNEGEIKSIIGGDISIRGEDSYLPK